MPYDLYGQYYASERDAINAEMAQCAEIDARIASKKVNDLKRQIQNREVNDYGINQKVDFLMSKVKELENRIKELEK